MPSQHQENLETLLEVSRLLSSKVNLPDVLRAVIELGARVVAAETASLLLVDPATDELYFDVALGMDPELAKVRLKKGQGIAGAVAQDNRAVILDDARKDERWSPQLDRKSGFTTRSILAVPLSLKGRCIGVVEAINKIDGSFNDDDRRTLEAFASQAAIAIDNARLFSSLSEERAKLATVLNEMRDAAILADESGAILLANQAARNFLPDDAPGRPRSISEAVAGMAVSPDLPSILRSREPMVRFEAAREAPKRLVLAGTSSLVRSGGASGRAQRVIVFRDVTEERHEEGLKRNFLSLISHKLKTPLASITGFSQLLLEDLKSKTGLDFYAKSLGTINGQGQKLAALVDKLLNYTVLESLDDSNFARSQVDVDAVLQEVVKSMEGWLQERSGKVLLEAGSGLSAYTHPEHLRDVIKNLIENGVKFDTHPQRKVAVWASPAGERVEIHFRDSGPGIPPEERDKIFQRFYQVESSFTGQVEGWGLGLSFVKGVVERLGGEVRVQSSPEAGSTFTVSLPARAA